MARITDAPITHSRLGASGFRRWSTCPGSVRLIAQLGPGDHGKSREAAEGTAAHLLAATCLTEGREAWEFLGQEIHVADWAFLVDDEMMSGVQVYLDFVREKVAQHEGAELIVERSMDSVLDEDAYGTADARIEVPGDRLIVVDLKFGRGVSVEPDDGQLIYYSFLGLENRRSRQKFKVVEQYIVQPRLFHPKGPIRRHVTNEDEIHSWFTDVALPAMERTRDSDAPLVIGEGCRFCPARSRCPALVRDVTTVETDRDLVTFSNDELAALLVRKNAVTKFFEDAWKEAFKRALDGQSIPGQKLVRQVTHRTWRDPKAAEAELSRDIGLDVYEPAKLKSPAQVEKLPGGKAKVAALAYSPTGALTMAPEGDKRKAVTVTPEDAFGSATNQTA